MDEKNITGIILSAGYSSRMGKTKALLDYEGVPFIVQILLKMSFVCDRVVIVLGHNEKEIKSTVRKYLKPPVNDTGEPNLLRESLLKIKDSIKFVKNENFELGMITSLKAGLSKAMDADWVLYHFVDQPGLPFSFYEDFVLQADDNFSWIQPMYRTRPGHPLLLNKSIFRKLTGFSNFRSLKDFSLETELNKKFWNCSYSQVLQDIDTMKEYKSISRS